MQPRTLLIGPGGAKGFMFIGALSKLEQLNIVQYIDTFAGVSAGALIVALCNVGLSAYEIFDIAITIDLFPDIMRDVNMNRILQSYGLLSHKTLRERLNIAIKNKLGYIPTFQQLHYETKKTLYIGVTNINAEFQFFSYKTTPNLSIIDAVIMSSSIPAVFECIPYKDTYYIDGAVSNPYPIDVLYKLSKQGTIGICLEEQLSIKDIFSFLQIVFNIPLRRLRLEHIAAVDDENVIHLVLKCNDNVVLGFEQPLKDRYAMLISGYEQADIWISEMLE